MNKFEPAVTTHTCLWSTAIIFHNVTMPWLESVKADTQKQGKISLWVKIITLRLLGLPSRHEPQVWHYGCLHLGYLGLEVTIF